jgi:hypothetical protein
LAQAFGKSVEATRLESSSLGIHPGIPASLNHVGFDLSVFVSLINSPDSKETFQVEPIFPVIAVAPIDLIPMHPFPVCAI